MHRFRERLTLHYFRAFSPSRQLSRRQFSTPSSSAPKDSRSRLRSLNDRLPPFLRTYTTPLLGAPGTHITSFLILHEITAIAPLFGLVAAFHYGNWLPDLSANDAFDEGTKRFGRWLRKKGWVEDDIEVVATDGQRDSVTSKQIAGNDKKGVRLVLEFATAYAVTKALLPLRVAASVWATPWFARAVLTPVGKGVQRLLGRK
ncbi:hypothetical protein BDV25DRAFT_155069 [Aspergillus avenaceus]|uniref:Uncharacterized protein n=1 Tax=Aspergillus avenaceus TaxID=36643 RepID=A0A5N6TUR9_ASPAV|nr:hypothetical protein BDV25DRAFT_155069 [Aspergillus avenaceus]